MIRAYSSLAYQTYNSVIQDIKELQLQWLGRTCKSFILGLRKFNALKRYEASFESAHHHSSKCCSYVKNTHLGALLTYRAMLLDASLTTAMWDKIVFLY